MITQIPYSSFVFSVMITPDFGKSLYPQFVVLDLLMAVWVMTVFIRSCQFTLRPKTVLSALGRSLAVVLVLVPQANSISFSLSTEYVLKRKKQTVRFLVLAVTY